MSDVISCRFNQEGMKNEAVSHNVPDRFRK